MGYRARVQQTVSIGQVADDILVRLVVGQNKAAERLLALSSAKVPFQDGDLSNSGHVDPATDADESADVVYDDVKAARWHEDQPLIDSLGRKYKGNSNFQNGRSSHYLSEPAEQNKDELVGIIRKEGRGG
ncbi:hypothetical protein [Herbiconiux sp. YIM B11900]|uniref:hypothetical protein n=1 Tax=Herbiconiux sp. YIM B11900 TaxID=3404131 RepID=UPI003F86A0C5